jgi:hypothetical protein
MGRVVGAVAAMGILASFGVPGKAIAQQGASERGRIAIELNKLEQVDQACRAYLLFENETDKQFVDFRLDLILFGADGVIMRRIAVDSSPLRAGKSVVKLFDLADLRCEDMARILLNDVAPCADDEASRQDCVDLVTPNSRTEVVFFK